MTKKYILTFDIDWAPDYAIQHCLNLLDEKGVSATFFATHPTYMNNEIKKRATFLGFIPTFFPNRLMGLLSIQLSINV